jgi:serine protease AprX
MMIRRLRCIVFASLLPSLIAVAGIKTSPRLAAALSSVAPRGTVPAWIYFADKGPGSLEKALRAEDLVTERSLRRRTKAMPVGRLVDETDLPVHDGYVGLISHNVSRVRHMSKWLNAVSVDATREQLETVEKLPCVTLVDVVAMLGLGGSRENVQRTPPDPGTRLTKPGSTQSLDYGGSLPQVSLENIPAVHGAGYAGQGVLIGVFDDGFRLLSHTAFDTLRARIVGTYDFVEHKIDVAPSDTSLGEHGVTTLSVLAGYVPGTLIGPAFRSSFLLARTEYTPSETPIEEDNWVRAIEWADSLGVDVTSTSLGYDTFDPPYTSLTWADMNGRTTAMAIAATAAARKGIIMVVAAGNEARTRASDPNSLLTPADADSILTVGAVNAAGVRAYFSSFGPTADGRIKPDVMAVGMSIRAAVGSGVNDYTSSIQGTSYACPIAAGIAAMILSARPNATAMQVIAAMKSTANRAYSPDNYYGWGVVNALAAIHALTNNGYSLPEPGHITLEQNFPNPFNPLTHIQFALHEDAHVIMRVYDLLGREVTTLVDRDCPSTLGGPNEVVWDGTDARGNPVAGGVYIYRMTATTGNTTLTEIRKMVLLR